MTISISPKRTAEKKDLEPIAVNSKEACRLLNISTGTLTRLTRENLIPHVRLQYGVRYPVEGLKQFAAGKFNQD